MDGFFVVLQAYPVHIMTVVGTVMLFILILPKRKRRRNQPSAATEPRTEKRKLTADEKQVLAEKIRNAGTENLKKSFAGEDKTKYKVFVTILLIAVILFWIVLLILSGMKAL